MPGSIASGVGSIVGGFNQDRAAKRNVREARRQFGAINTLVSPFAETGQEANALLADDDALRAAFTTDPGYEFRLNEGTQNVLQNRALAGLLRSGSAIKDTLRFGQGLASSEFGNFVGRKEALANRGVNAAGVLSGNSANLVNATSRGNIQSANAQNAILGGLGEIAGGIAGYKKDLRQ